MFVDIPFNGIWSSLVGDVALLVDEVLWMTRLLL